MHTLNEASATRQVKHLLDSKIQAERALAALSEDLGWTLKYAWQLKPGDVVAFNGAEGPVVKIEDGPLGRAIHLDDFSKHLHPEDLVTLHVPESPEPF